VQSLLAVQVALGLGQLGAESGDVALTRFELRLGHFNLGGLGCGTCFDGSELGLEVL
jgi:hypothetical protein